MGMLFNCIGEPIFSYFYTAYILGAPAQAAEKLAKFNAVTTFTNAVIAVIAATIFYLALRPALRRMKLLPEL